MPDSPRFPVSCRLDVVVLNGIAAPFVAPFGLAVELGPNQDQCEPPSDPKGARALLIDAAPAPQPARAIATDWSQPPQLPRTIRTFREAANTRHTDPSVSALVWHAPVYSPGRCSLSIRFAVHDTNLSLNTGRNFGRHVRSLRRARGMTQEVLAERSGLSPDTIRRLEHGSFSPSLETLRKLCCGLDLMLSTLFESYELGTRDESRELVDLLATRTPREMVLATRVLRALFDELDGIATEAAAEALAVAKTSES